MTYRKVEPQLIFQPDHFKFEELMLLGEFLENSSSVAEGKGKEPQIKPAVNFEDRKWASGVPVE